MKIFVLIFLSYFICTLLFAGSPDWELPLGDDVLKIDISSENHKMIYVSQDWDNTILTCVNYLDGTILWKFELPGLFDEQVDICRFVDKKTVYTGRNNEHVFLNADNGEVVDSFSLACEKWGHILWENDIHTESSYIIKKPIFENGFAIFSSLYGFQILDLNNKTLLYSFTNDAKNIILMTQQHYKCFIIEDYGIVILDTRERKIVLDEPFFIINLSFRMKNPIILHNGYGTFFCEDQIKFYNLSTGSHISDFAVEPTDSEYLGTIDIGLQLCVLHSTEKYHELIDIRSGKIIFQTKEHALPGYIEKIITSEDKKYYLIIAYDNDENIASLYKIDSKTMKILWEKDLFEYDDDFEVEFLNESAISNYLKILSYANLSKAFASGKNDLSDQIQYRRNVDRNISNTLRRNINLVESKCDGYAHIVFFDNDKLKLFCLGEIKSLLKEIDDENEQECIATIDINNGSLLDYHKCKINDTPEDGDAINAAKVLSMLYGICIFGKNNCYIMRDDNIEPFDFYESVLTILDNSGESIVFSSYDQNNDIYDIYRFDVSENTSKLVLLTESEKNDVLYYDSYYDMPYTIKIDDDFISFYNPIKTIANESVFKDPVIQISTDDFDIGSFDNYPKIKIDNFFQGIKRVENGYIFAGFEAIGFISDDAKCKWTVEWSAEPFDNTSGIIDLNDYITYECTDQVGIIEKGCSGQIILQEDYLHGSDHYMVVPDKSGIVVVIDNNIQFYNLK